MRRIFLFFFIPFILLNLSGCVPVVILGAAAAGAGAYTVSRDTIEGETDKPYDSLWNSALIVSKIRGTIKYEDYAKGCIELETLSGRAWIRLVRLTRATVRLRISARRYHLSNLDLAQDIYVKIIEEAK